MMITEWLNAPDVLQLSKRGKRAMGRVDQAPSHSATPTSLLMGAFKQRYQIRHSDHG